MLGTLYDYRRVIHLFLGLPEPPPPPSISEKGMVCTDVVTRSLPPGLVKAMYAWLQINHPDPLGVSAQLNDGEIFISPNGIAWALGLPHSRHITKSAQPFVPVIHF
jgi:hypothetical protein